MIKAILLATVVPFMAQHRNIVPSNEVTTNFYGSVTGVVTRAYIAEHGGGGLEPRDVGLIATNVVTNVVTKSYVEGLGVSGGNVLHFNGGQSTEFVEGTAKLIEFVNSGKPLFCLYGGNIWAGCSSITPTTISGIQMYYISFVCNNPSAYANGVASPLILTCALFPSLNSHQVFSGTYRLLSDNLQSLTNSVNFKAAVETFIPPAPDPIVTNLYNVSRTSIIDGDRNVYVKLPYSAWTNDVAGGGGSIPAGLCFTPTMDYDTRYYVFAWEAKNGSDIYTLQKMSQPGGVFYYDLKKNREAPFPQAAVLASESATVLDFRTFKLYRFGSGDILVNTDTLALGSFVSNVQTQVSTLDTKVNNRTARGYLASTIGWGNNTQAGLLGLYSAANDEPLWPFSMAYWGSVIYPDVKTWVGNNYVPKTRKINGQPLTTDITIQSMDYQAVTNTVNAVKAQFYDEPLQVNWTLKMVNGEMKLYATTNVNMSVL